MDFSGKQEPTMTDEILQKIKEMLLANKDKMP
jgi:hypothetical protein